MTETPLFDLPVYPDAAGWKDHASETSEVAAESVDAPVLRVKVLAHLFTRGPQTADEAAAALRIDKLAVRPRFSELRRLGLVYDTGARRQNASGRKAIVWAPVRGSGRES